MKPDTRGFLYPLEALRRKRAWELDAARMDLAHATRKLQRAQEHLDRLEVRFAAARAEVARRNEDHRAFNGEWHRLASTYLADLIGAMASARRDVLACDKARDLVSARVAEAQRGLEAVQRHHDEARAEHTRAAGRREYAQADERWTHKAAEGDPA